MKKILLLVLSIIATVPDFGSAGTISTRSTAPITCTVGDIWINPGADTNDRIYTCTATNTWTKNTLKSAVDSKADAITTQLALDGKAGVSCFDSASAFNACFTLDWPTGGTTYTAGTGITITDGVIASTVVDTDTFASWDKDYADLTNKPTIPDITGLEPSLGNPSVNGYVLSSTTAGVRSWVEMTGGGTGIAHATADGNYYASKDGGWASLTGLYAPALGADDNYVTDAEKTKIAGIAEGAEVNVNADWNSSSGDSQILNKPTIPTVSTAAYNTSTWDASTSAPDQNALRDYLINFDSDGDGDFTDEAWFPTGSSMVYPGAGIPNSTGSAWGTSLGLVTTVGATGADTNVPTEQAVREAINALQNIVFGTGLTLTEDTPTIGTDTVSVTPNTYQAYDADWLGITANGAALVSAVNYADMKTLLDIDDIQTLTGIAAGTANLGTFTGSTIEDSSTIKSGMQALETAVEGKQASNANLTDLADGKLTGSKVGGSLTATASKATDYTIGSDDPDEAYGGVIYVTSAATIAAPVVDTGMSFSVITIGAVAVSLDVNASDRMYLDGTALDDGDKATNTGTSGDIITCSYESAAGWYCMSGSADGDKWTDGGQ